MEHYSDCEFEGPIDLFGFLFDDDHEILTRTIAPKLNIFSSTEDWNEYFTLDDDEETTFEFPRFEIQLNFSKKLRTVLNKAPLSNIQHNTIFKKQLCLCYIYLK